VLDESDRKIARLCAERGRVRCDVEREEIGATHAEIGAYLLTLWGLPDGIIEATAFHHEPARAGSVACVTTAVHAASALLSDDAEVLDETYLAALDWPEAGRAGKRRLRRRSGDCNMTLLAARAAISACQRAPLPASPRAARYVSSSTSASSLSSALAA